MTSVLFIHHSIGEQIVGAGLRGLLPSDGVDLWDHDYNDKGLTGPDGAATGTSFPVPNDDTDPKGLVDLVEALATDRLANVPGYDLLVLKSCFPNSTIDSEEASAALQDVYLRLRTAVDRLPSRVLLLSSPPLVVEATDRGQVARAIAMREWLAHQWVGDRRSFADLHATLSYASGPLRGTLRTGYRAKRKGDSHLSGKGAAAGARLVAEAILRAAAD